MRSTDFTLASFRSLSVRPLVQEIVGTKMDHWILRRLGAFRSFDRWSILLCLTFDLSQGPEGRGKEEESREKGNKEETDE